VCRSSMCALSHTSVGVNAVEHESKATAYGTTSQPETTKARFRSFLIYVKIALVRGH